MREIWAVMCGSINDQFDFELTLFRLLSLRKDGVISQIVLSTWNGGVEEGLRQKLISHGVLIVTTEAPDFEKNDFIESAYYPQAIQLRAALNVVPDDVFILKCRTDFSLDVINNLLPTIMDESSNIIVTRNVFNIDFSYKIIVSNISLNWLFEMGDKAYFGWKADIEKMVNFESLKLLVNNQLPPDSLFFVNPFIHRFKLIRDHIRKVSFWTFSVLVRDHGIRDPPLYIRRLYAFYFQLCDSCFVTPALGHCSVFKTLEDVFNPKSFGTVPWNMPVDIHVVRNILSGRYEGWGDFATTLGAMRESSMESGFSNNSFSAKEVRDLIFWRHNDYSDLGSPLMRTTSKLNKAECTSVDDDLLLIHGAEHSPDIEGVMSRLSVSTNLFSDLYRESINCDCKSLSEKMLITACRGLLPEAIHRLALMLIGGSLSQENRAASEALFRKYGTNRKTLFKSKSPMIVAANIYYVLYSKDQSYESELLSYYGHAVNSLSNMTAIDELLEYIYNEHNDDFASGVRSQLIEDGIVTCGAASKPSEGDLLSSDTDEL